MKSISYSKDDLGGEIKRRGLKLEMFYFIIQENLKKEAVKNQVVKEKQNNGIIIIDNKGVSADGQLQQEKDLKYPIKLKQRQYSVVVLFFNPPSKAKFLSPTIGFTGFIGSSLVSKQSKNANSKRRSKHKNPSTLSEMIANMPTQENYKNIFMSRS